MGQQIGLGEAISASVRGGVRLVLGVVILSALILVTYRAIVFFVGSRGRDLGRRRYRWIVENFGAVLVLLLLQGPMAHLLTSLGMSVTRLISIRDETWASSAFVGLYNTVTALAVLLLTHPNRRRSLLALRETTRELAGSACEAGAR